MTGYRCIDYQLLQPGPLLHHGIVFTVECYVTTVKNELVLAFHEVLLVETRKMEKTTYNTTSVLAWRIPGTEEPGGLPSLESHRVGHD